MKTALVVMLALILGLGVVSVTPAHISPSATEGQSGSLMGLGMGEMMGGGQMGQMMPTFQVMQACTEMMNQMSGKMGQQGAPQQQPPQPEKK